MNKTTKPKSDPLSEPWSAPESGTVRDETSGNQPAHPHERGFNVRGKSCEGCKDDPSEAGEER